MCEKDGTKLKKALASDSDQTMDISRLPEELQELVTLEKTELNVKVIKPDTYVQNHPNAFPSNWRRKAFILNIIEGTNFSKRVGAEKDSIYMKNLLTQLDFEITEVPNAEKDKESIKKKLMEFVEVCKQDQVDCIVVFVGSHGANHIIQTSDDKFLEMYNDIIYSCQFKILDQKCVEKRVVKIFINSSCQVDLPKGLTLGKPKPVVMKDSIYAVAQIPKFEAERDEYCGTYYAVVLTYVFMKMAWNTPVLELFHEVQKLLPEFAKCGDAIQHPPIIMGLNQPFYFFKNPYDFQFDVLQPVSLFTGRKAELSEIHQKFKEQNQVNLDAKKVAIVGLGGMGKTQIVRAFCQQFVGAVIWISAEKEQNIIESFRKVATERLNIPSRNADDKEKEIVTIVEEVFNKFLGKPCLFVFDNVEKPEKLREFLRFPDPSPNPPYILITSRDTEWERSSATLNLTQMSQVDSIEFVKRGLEIKQNDESQAELILKLVGHLENYPLALSIAIAFIQQRKHLCLKESITKFLKQYESSPRFLFDGETNEDFNRYTETIFKILDVTLERISSAKYGKEAICLLKMISYFEPDKIPMSIISSENIKDIMTTTDSYFHQLFSYLYKFFSYFHTLFSYFWGSRTSVENADIDDEDEAICLLTKYAVIYTQPEEETISIHRLVQEVTRLKIRDENKEEVILRCVMNFFRKFKLADLSLDRTRHCYSVFKYCNAHTVLVYDFSIFPLLILAVLDKHGRWRDVINIGANLKQTLTSNRYKSVYYLIRMDFLVAYANLQLGKYRVSRDIYEQTFELCNQQNMLWRNRITNQWNMCRLSENEMNIARGYYVRTLKELGQIKDCLDTLNIIYKRNKALFGEKDLETIKTLVEIADCLYNVLQTDVKDDRFPTQDEVTTVLKEFYDTNICSIASRDRYWVGCMTKIAKYFYKTKDMKNARIIAEGVSEEMKNSEEKEIQLFVWECCCILRDIEQDEGNYEVALKKGQECHALFLKIATEKNQPTSLFGILRAANSKSISFK